MSSSKAANGGSKHKKTRSRSRKTHKNNNHSLKEPDENDVELVNGNMSESGEEPINTERKSKKNKKKEKKIDDIENGDDKSKSKSTNGHKKGHISNGKNKSNKSNKVVKIRIADASTIKILLSALTQSFTNIVFALGRDGVRVRRRDEISNQYLIDLFLQAKCFVRYSLPSVIEESDDEVVLISVIATDMKDIMSIAKKSDIMTMWILEDDPTQLYIKILDKSKTKGQLRKLTIQSDGDYDNTQTPPRYKSETPTYAITGKDFKTLCTSKKNQAWSVKIEAQKYGFIFTVYDDDDDEVTAYDFGWKKHRDIVYSERFPLKVLNQMVNCGNLSDHIRVYAQDKLPLKIEADVGTIGTITYYLQHNDTE